MSTARNIPNDRGLTLRMFITGLLLVLLYGAVIGLLIAVGISYAFVLVIAGAAPVLPVLVQRQDRPLRHGRPRSSPPSRPPSSTGPSTGSAPWPT